jgi:HlyD family secretion protein
LLPYLTANVRFILHRETSALLVPNAALRWSPSSLAQVAPDARTSNLLDPPGDAASATSAQQKNSQRVLWIKSGAFVRPLAVAAGISDGAYTVVSADGLREGDEVVTGEIFTAQTDVKNPFLPKIIRR